VVCCDYENAYQYSGENTLQKIVMSMVTIRFTVTSINREIHEEDVLFRSFRITQTLASLN
jgi:NurA-like 5'-3' nuclease